MYWSDYCIREVKKTQTNKTHFDGFNPTSSETHPIIAYIMKGGEIMNGGFSKSFNKWGHWTSAETPPPFWI